MSIAPACSTSLWAGACMHNCNSRGTHQHTGHSGMKVLTLAPPAKDSFVVSVFQHMDYEPTHQPMDIPYGGFPFRPTKAPPYPSLIGKVIQYGNTTKQGNCESPTGSSAGHRPLPLVVTRPTTLDADNAGSTLSCHT